MQQRRFKQYRNYKVTNAPIIALWKVAQAARRRALLLGTNGDHSEAEWQAITGKQGGLCALCGNEAPLVRDHILPISLGGTNFAYNIQGLCARCNGEKHNAIPSTMQLSLWDRLELLDHKRPHGPKPGSIRAWNLKPRE